VNQPAFITDVAEGARVARSSSVIADASWASRLELMGPDRVKFLDGQLTQHVAARAVGEGGYGFVLEAKGAGVTDLDFLVLEESLAIDLPAARKAAVQGWLGRYLVLSDAELVDRDADTFGLLLIGPESAAALEVASGVTWSQSEGAGGAGMIAGVPITVRHDRTCGVPGYRLRGPVTGRDAVVEALASPRVGLDVVDVLRVEAGRPWFGRDLDPSVLPKESGQEDRAVDYEKGCYCGQEVVARQHYIGKPRKQLVGLSLAAEGAREGDAVRGGETELGRVTSLVWSPTLDRFIALAILKGGEHAPGDVLAVINDKGRASIDAEVAALPFVTRT